MGTNYYRILSEEEMKTRNGYIKEHGGHQQLEKLVADGVPLCDIYNWLYNYVPHDGTPGFSNKIHIGKRSMGWEFLFAKNIDEFCGLHFDAIYDWLDAGKIINEYGEVISTDDFFKMVDEASMLASRHYTEDAYEFHNGFRLTDDYIDFC